VSTIECINSLFAFHKNYASTVYILYRFLRYMYSELFVESRTFFYAACIWRSADFWQQKTRVARLSCGVVCVICLAVLTELPICYRQTDRRTHGRSIYRARIASCGKNRQCHQDGDNDDGDQDSAAT